MMSDVPNNQDLRVKWPGANNHHHNYGNANGTLYYSPTVTVAR